MEAGDGDNDDGGHGSTSRSISTVKTELEKFSGEVDDPPATRVDGPFVGGLLSGD